MPAFVLAASLLLAAAPATAQAPAPAAPAPQELVDRFLAAMPHQEEWAMSRDPDPKEVARIAALNPGHEAEVRPILAEHARCFAPVAEAATRRALATIARGFGADKLRGLISLYQSAEFRRFDAIEARQYKGEKLGVQEESEFRRFLADHPAMLEFGEALRNAGPIMTADADFMSATGACVDARQAAFDRAKLRAN